jgi:hypothetical protein
MSASGLSGGSPPSATARARPGGRRAGEVERPPAAAAGQDEAGQRLEILVHRVDLALEPVDLRLDDARSAPSKSSPGWRGRRRDRTIRSGSRQHRARRASSRRSSATPIALLASSTSPIAACAARLGRALPSTSPVSPASPVRV